MSNKYYPNTHSVTKIIMQIRDNLQKNLKEITKHEIRKIFNQKLNKFLNKQVYELVIFFI